MQDAIELKITKKTIQIKDKNDCDWLNLSFMHSYADYHEIWYKHRLDLGEEDRLLFCR